MANVLIEEQTMSDIADAIREKNGTSNTYFPADMPQAVKDIEDTGMGSRQWWEDVVSEKTSFTEMFYKCISLTTIPKLDTSNGKSFGSMFSNCTSLTTIPKLDTSNGTYFFGMFSMCKSLTTIPQLDISNGKNFNYMFQNCTSLTTIPQLDISNGTNFYAMFSNCTSLKHITFFAGCIKLSISFAQSSFLTDESVQSIIDGLADLTGQSSQTLSLHALVKEKLTDEQIAQITSKNWTLA